MFARRVRLAAFAAFAIGGCQAGKSDAEGDSSRAQRRRPAASIATKPWRIVPWEPYAGVDPSDLGIGVAYLRRAEDKGATSGVDTLLLRSAPNASAPPVGAMLFTVDSVGVTHYAIAAKDSLRPNLVEYGYEESGVPFDSADGTGRWVHALLGVAADGAVRVGWVDTSQPGIGLVRWAEQLADRPIFFSTPERAALFATPDSSKPVTVPAGGNDAYAIHPVEARGPWLRARLVEPSDNCEPDSVPRRTRTVWIRYLDDRGRPTVWYYPRGC
jgi:hypothetical protein